MYWITAMRDGTFWCEGRVQDGTERWSKPTRKRAVQSMIKFARVMNGSMIREDDIGFSTEEPPEPRVVSEEDWQLLQAIKSKAKVVLPCDHYLLKYRITEQECQMVQEIREGEVHIRRKA
jgi:hypothetical protein